MGAERERPVFWALCFLVVLAVAATGWLMPINRAVSGVLTGFGRQVPAANLVWILGGPSVTGLVVLITAVIRRQVAWVWLFAAGVLLEVMTKHWIAAPLPTATPEPLWMARIESWASPSAHSAIKTLASLLRLPRSTGAPSTFFHGSFFSGHVFRLTFTVGMLFRGRPWVLWVTALAAGVLVVATGGHWAWDVVGGYCVARTTLAVAQRVTR